MKKKFIACIFFIGWMGVFIPDRLACQSKTLLDEPVLIKLVDETENQVLKYERSGNHLLFLVIMVGALGIIASGIQAMKKWKPVKTITVIIGILVSTLTLVIHTAFESNDFKLMKKTAGKCRKCLIDVRLKMATPYADNEERKEILKYIKAELEEIEDSFFFASDAGEVAAMTGTSPYFLYALQATDSQPQWITKTPSDDENFYFSAVGVGKSLDEAKKNSLQKTLELAQEFFLYQLEKVQRTMTSNINNTILSEYLMNSAETAETFFFKDTKTGLYNFYTLIKVEKEDVQFDLKFYGLQEKQKVPGEYQDIAQIDQSKESLYYEKRADIGEKLLRQSKAVLSPLQMELLNSGRAARKNGSYQDSIHMLERLISERPDCFIAWYNLGLSYEAVKNYPKANEAYLKAVQLEPGQAVRDSSIYNTYGYFLFIQKRCPEAVGFLKKALEIEPDHPKAKRTLKAAEECLR